jgi:uncharacterized membrane protein
MRSPWYTPDDAPSPIRSLPTENPKRIGVFLEQFHCSTAATDEFQGTEVSVLAPCQDGEVPLEPSPSVSITVSVVSIDLTAISIAVAASDDEEGVVLPRG